MGLAGEAKWRMRSIEPSGSKGFEMSCETNWNAGWERRCAMLRSLPVMKLSTHRTVCPSARNRHAPRTRGPHPPVERVRPP